MDVSIAIDDEEPRVFPSPSREGGGLTGMVFSKQGNQEQEVPSSSSEGVVNNPPHPAEAYLPQGPLPPPPVQLPVMESAPQGQLFQPLQAEPGHIPQEVMIPPPPVPHDTYQSPEIGPLSYQPPPSSVEQQFSNVPPQPHPYFPDSAAAGPIPIPVETPIPPINAMSDLKIEDVPGFLPGPFATTTPTPIIPAPEIVPVQVVQQQPVLIPFSPRPPISSKVTPPPSASTSAYNNSMYTVEDVIYEAWIPKEETRRILHAVEHAMKSGTYFADKSHMTMPGIIYEDDLIDKVGVNMARIFGEAEASKRRILTADSVTQDDNGIRELIKLGCYRSAINLTKRLLTLYGQGPGKVGQFSKHNPHTLQLWFTRISLFMRIREFTVAESEIDAFKEFENPDLYYEYYPDSYGKGRKGSMVPFHFRVLAAEIPQYSRKFNDTINRLTRILQVAQQVIQNVENGLTEDGESSPPLDEQRKQLSLEIWHKRELRVLYGLVNASVLGKDHHNSFRYLNILCEKDKGKEPQLRSAMGRFFLQLGDLTSGSHYFQMASDLRQGDSEAEQAENLIDSAMISITHGGYPEAYALFKQALSIQPDNFMITNNMAVCLLYMGKVKDALDLMENTVKNNTPQLLQENVLLNLSTVYELENTDGHKKNALLKLVSEYKGDGINLASLKMPNLI